jgi:chromosome segregation ATPase
MIIPIAVAVALLSAVLVAVMSVRMAKKSSLIDKQRGEISGLSQNLSSQKIQLDQKDKLAQQLRSDIDRVREEARKAKKKAYEACQNGKSKRSAGVDEDTERVYEDAMLEAKAEARRYKKQVELLEDENKESKAVQSKLKEEISEFRRLKKENQNRQVPKNAEDPKELKVEIRKLKTKLESAARRSRTEDQIYRVTNSKLELAMERINGLQQQISSLKQTTRQAS